MEGPSIVPIIVPTIVFLTVAVSMFLMWFCHVKRLMRHAQHLQSVTATHHPQYSYHQPVANNLHPAYGGHPILTRPCQQTYVPGPPPTYQEPAGLFPAPFSQAAYDGGQIMYPVRPQVQPALPTDYTSPQVPIQPCL